MKTRKLHKRRNWLGVQTRIWFEKPYGWFYLARESRTPAWPVQRLEETRSDYENTINRFKEMTLDEIYVELGLSYEGYPLPESAP